MKTKVIIEKHIHFYRLKNTETDQRYQNISTTDAYNSIEKLLKNARDHSEFEGMILEEASQDSFPNEIYGFTKHKMKYHKGLLDAEVTAYENNRFSVQIHELLTYEDYFQVEIKEIRKRLIESVAFTKKSDAMDYAFDFMKKHSIRNMI